MVKERPKIEIFDPVADIAAKFDFYIKIVVCILVVAVITMLFMVGGLLLDAWHFNSAVYKEYSGKIDILDSNKQNQEIIIKQQAQIEKLLEDVNKKLAP